MWLPSTSSGSSSLDKSSLRLICMKLVYPSVTLIHRMFEDKCMAVYFIYRVWNSAMREGHASSQGRGCQEGSALLPAPGRGLASRGLRVHPSTPGAHPGAQGSWACFGRAAAVGFARALQIVGANSGVKPSGSLPGAASLAQIPSPRLLWGQGEVLSKCYKMSQWSHWMKLGVSMCSTVVAQARFTEAVWLGAGTLRVPSSQNGAQLCDVLTVYTVETKL